VDLACLCALWPALGELPAEAVEQIETDARYAGYLERQEADIQAFRRDEALVLPAALDYAAIPGLSNEARQVLLQARPATLGAAARLSGITPAATVTLLRYVRRVTEPGRAA
jgi:tRNA uridine 5-carboxymethylaminomethyl modification enzyme